jgi:site-specific recombinase XerD
MIRNYGIKAELTKKVSPHMLRHSFASNMLKNQADLRTLQALLGHSSIQTTEIYTHLTSQQLHETYLLHHPFAKKGDFKK